MLLMAQADARALPFADVCVQCVVTSPPYFGLRDYGTARWEGGDPACDHFRLAGGTNAQGLGKSAAAVAANVERSSVPFPVICGKCGARRIDQQLGLEPTIDAYVANLVTVFREVWRVLKSDGVCWLNLGDSYANTSAGAGGQGKQWTNHGTVQMRGITKAIPSGLKPKDLCMIPARVALALQADGWYLRSEIVWSKPNPMPESVTDRPTKAHEMIYLLAKQERYYYDADAVRERAFQPIGHARTAGAQLKQMAMGRIVGSLGTNYGLPDRNLRSVWYLATQAYPGAHFATFPERLVERCILAGSRAGDVVLDPFMGSGTVARVALRLGRKALGCDLNPAYLDLADDRTRVTYGLPFSEPAQEVV